MGLEQEGTEGTSGQEQEGAMDVRQDIFPAWWQPAGDDVTPGGEPGDKTTSGTPGDEEGTGRWRGRSQWDGRR